MQKMEEIGLKCDKNSAENSNEVDENGGGGTGSVNKQQPKPNLESKVSQSDVISTKDILLSRDASLTHSLNINFDEFQSAMDSVSFGH